MLSLMKWNSDFSENAFDSENIRSVEEHKYLYLSYPKKQGIEKLIGFNWFKTGIKWRVIYKRITKFNFCKTREILRAFNQDLLHEFGCDTFTYEQQQR